MNQSTELTSEDHLRINVLMAQADAVRIDEHAMRVVGRTGQREWSVQLHPRGADYRYLQTVRRLLSELVLGQPFSFPVYIKRWSRSGSLGGIKPRHLLKLGEPEAVRAVAMLPGLDEEVAELAWWADSSPEVARSLLENCGGATSLGQKLAEFLIDHLAFEDDAEAEMETVRQLLRPGLLSQSAIEKLWARRLRKPQYRVGFLQQAADRLLEPEAAHPQFALHQEALRQLSTQGNAIAAALYRLLDAPGQTFLRECQVLIENPLDQAVICEAANALGEYLQLLERDQMQRDLEAIVETATRDANQPGSAAHDVVALDTQLAPLVTSLQILAGVSERIYYATFARTTASGTLLRRKLLPISRPLVTHIERLRYARDSKAIG